MKDKGICRFCLKTYSGAGMGRHLFACKARKEETNKEVNQKVTGKSIYHLKIWGYKPYWLHIEMNSIMMLKSLDQFLRNIWLECCGHLSQFTIREVHYHVDVGNDWYGWGKRPRTMNYQLKKVLKPKDTFEYEYDFGSTTYLTGQVLDERPGKLKEGVKIMTRNNPLVYDCTNCEAKATNVCLECNDFYCETCLEKHECSEEMYLPIVNSPRMGVCGYTGYPEIDSFMAERFNN